MEEGLRAQIADLVALEAARGGPQGGPSEMPRLVAAQLRVEALEARLALALGQQVRGYGTDIPPNVSWLPPSRYFISSHG